MLYGGLDMYNATNNYDKYKEMQNDLVELIDESTLVINKLNTKMYEDTLKKLKQKVANDSLKIQVVGTFKNGKSTFINSFLGDEVLPAYATPCTAVVNEVKYGDPEKAVLYFKDPIPAQIAEEISPMALEHMKKHNMKKVPPITIPYESLEEYAVIPMGKDAKDMLLESPYEKIELYWPLDLLRNNIEIVDSPGLNEHGTRTQMTAQYISNADSVLFVLTALQLCSKEEMMFIENNLRRIGFTDIYFLVNRFDDIRTDNDRKRIKYFAKTKLSDKTSFGENGIFFISSLNALEGKLNNNNDQYLNSGLPAFESELSNYLVNQKGKIKMSQPVIELSTILKETSNKHLPNEIKMLNSDIDELRKRYEEEKPKLEQVKRKKIQIETKINSLINHMMPNIKRCVSDFYIDFDRNLPIWVEDYETTTDVKVLHAKESCEELITEITEFIKDKIEDEQSVWQKDTFQPLLSNGIQNILDSVEGNIENIFVDIDRIKINISGGNTDDIEQIPVWKRIAAFGGGLIVGGIGGAAMGGIMGLDKDFVKCLAIQVAAFIGLGIIGLLNPLTIIATIVVGLIVGISKATEKIVKKVKDKVVENVRDSINSEAVTNIDEIMSTIHKEISKKFSTITDSLDVEIKEVESQVQNVLGELQKGQVEVDKRMSELKSCEQKVVDIKSRLKDFAGQIGISKKVVI